MKEILEPLEVKLIVDKDISEIALKKYLMTNETMFWPLYDLLRKLISHIELL